MLYHFSFFSCLWCVYRFKHFHFHSNSLFYGHETTTKKKIQILYTPIDNFDLIYFRHWMICIHLMIRFLVWPVSSFVSCCFFFFVCSCVHPPNIITTNQSVIYVLFCSLFLWNSNLVYIYICIILFILQIEYALLQKRMFKGILMVTHISANSFYRNDKSRAFRRGRNRSTLHSTRRMPYKIYTNTHSNHLFIQNSCRFAESWQMKIGSTFFFVI